jgi:hypothetical protein
MKRLVHKPILFFLKTGLTILLVALVWFVRAGSSGNENDFDEVKIVKFYPNPATSFINFEFPENIDRTYFLEIYSFTGKKVAELPVSASRLSLTFNNDFYRGIYVFRLRDKEGKTLDSGKFQVIR